jgi:hypothetical protein
LVKKTDVRELPGPSAQLFVLTKINSGDELLQVLLTGGNDEMILVSKSGMMIRFAESEVRPMGLVAAGVNGIKLSNGDEVIGGMVHNKDEDLLLISEDGKAWRIPASQTVLQGRYGQGIIAARLAKGSGLSGAVSGPANLNVLVYFERLAAKSIRLDNLPAVKRASSGKPVFELKAGEKVIGVVPIIENLGRWETTSPQKLVKRTRRTSEKATTTVSPSSRPPNKQAPTRRRSTPPTQAELPLESKKEAVKSGRAGSRQKTSTSSTAVKKSDPKTSTRKGKTTKPATQDELIQPVAKKRGRKPAQQKP